METSSGGRKRKSSVERKRKSKVSNIAGSGDEDEWLCARTFKASKIDKEVRNPKELARKSTNQSSKVDGNEDKQSSKWINRKTVNIEPSKAKGSVVTKSDAKEKSSQVEKAWNLHSAKRKNVIEEVIACTLVTPPIKTSNSVVSNASDVVPDSYASSSSSSSASSRKSTSSTTSARRSPFPRERTVCRTQERAVEIRSTCDSPVLPCTPIRTSHVRRISQVVQDVSIEESQRLQGCLSFPSPNSSQNWRNRRNSLDSVGSKTASSSQSSSSDTPKRFSRRSSLVNLRMETVELRSQKREASPVIMETNDFMGPLTVQKCAVPEKAVIDFSQLTSPIRKCTFKVPVLNIPAPEPLSTPDIEESCGGFQIQETCHFGLSESSASGAERFEIDDLDGKSIRCDDYMPKLKMGPVSPVRENLPRKRLPKLAGRLAKHLSSIRCDRLIVRRDPRAIIISLPISQTYSNWGLTIHGVAGTGQLVIVRDRLHNSRVPTSSLNSNNQASNYSASLQTETTKDLTEKDVKVSKSHQIVPPPPSFFSSSAGSALRAVVGAGTDSASFTAVECWLHLAQPYSLIRTSSRQPPAIINPIVIDR
ncbi:unnamed protein product [Auanema sp. JU1783]|nr:unnamed protein product [Auanema sp. JU1783]